MVINTDEEAYNIIGQQVYVISENDLIPMVVNEVMLTKTISGLTGMTVEAEIKTALGTFKAKDMFKDKDELIEYIDRVIQR